jgi:hypothetical protein
MQDLFGVAFELVSYRVGVNALQVGFGLIRP